MTANQNGTRNVIPPHGAQLRARIDDQIAMEHSEQSMEKSNSFCNAERGRWEPCILPKSKATRLETTGRGKRRARYPRLRTPDLLQSVNRTDNKATKERRCVFADLPHNTPNKKALLSCREPLDSARQSWVALGRR